MVGGLYVHFICIVTSSYCFNSCYNCSSYSYSFYFRKVKNKDKVSLKGIKTVVFNLNELVEDYMISTVSINKTLSHEAVLKALENLVNDKN